MQKRLANYLFVIQDDRDHRTESSTVGQAAKGRSDVTSWSLQLDASSVSPERLGLHLSKKDIPVQERLIVALDVPSYEDAMQLVTQLDGVVFFYKLGLELFASGDYHRLADELIARGVHVFADLKMFDVPITVSRAVEQMKLKGVEFVTVHGNDAMLEAACAGRA